VPTRDLRGCCVTGTDTGVGKTVVAAAIVARLRELGVEVRAFKPLLTGTDEPPDGPWPRDDELLARVAGADPATVVLRTYGPPVSPHLAAELAGEPAPSPAAIAGWVRKATPAGAVAVVEGIGGLRVPLGPGADVRALAAALALPLVIAARAGLGTINHTLLTLESARAAGLAVAGVVLTPWPERPGVIERSNRDTIAELGEVEVATLAPVAAPQAAALARAATGLPLERWLSLDVPSRPGHAPHVRPTGARPQSS
jgi:dethiobiotin synthetase